jgi:hypothetical protein
VRPGRRSLRLGSEQIRLLVFLYRNSHISEFGMRAPTANRLWALKDKGYVARMVPEEASLGFSAYWILTAAGKEVARPHAVKAALAHDLDPVVFHSRVSGRSRSP